MQIKYTTRRKKYVKARGRTAGAVRILLLTLGFELLWEVGVPKDLSDMLCIFLSEKRQMTGAPSAG
jgi:hypothetical protein